MTREQALQRCTRLVGPDAMRRLARAHVAVFGLGGVGSFAVEALSRSGVGSLRIVDHDILGVSNRNRQLMALAANVGRPKVQEMAARVRAIMPEVRVEQRTEFFAAESAASLLAGGLDVVVDAIDSVGPKVELLAQCVERGLPVVSVMGAAGRLDPTAIRCVPLALSRNDALAARVRKMLRRRGISEGVTAVYSKEPASSPLDGQGPKLTVDLCRGRQRVVQPSFVMVPAAMGMAAAAWVVRWLVSAEAPRAPQGAQPVNEAAGPSIQNKP